MLAAQRRSEIMARLERDGIVRVSALVSARRIGHDDPARPAGTPRAGRPREGARRRRHARGAQHGRTWVQGQVCSSARPEGGDRCARGPAYPSELGNRRFGRHHTFALARHIVAIPGLTVVTNSVWVADLLHNARGPSHTVLLTGGLRTPSDALVGPIAIAALRSLHLDTVFMGVHGMDMGAGYTTPNLLEAETNRAMIASGRRLVVVADATKWGVVGLNSMATLSKASALFTDASLSQSARQVLSDHVDDLVLVDPDERWVAGRTPTGRVWPPTSTGRRATIACHHRSGRRGGDNE